MKRYTLSLFKNPEMYDQGRFCLYEDALAEIAHQKKQKQLAHDRCDYWREEFKQLERQIGEIRTLAEEAQTRARDSDIKMKWALLFAAVVAVAGFCMRVAA